LFYLLASICQGLFLKQGFSSLLACLPTLALPTIDEGKVTVHQVLQLQ
jgi:hypothetical protein